jgi:chorismate-pyruvate lyase
MHLRKHTAATVDSGGVTSIHWTLMEDLADIFCALGLQMPEGRLLRPTEIPAPFYSLLVHQQGMTRRLEVTHDTTMQLKVLKSIFQEGVCTRQILLHTDNNTPVLLAFIRIHVNIFAFSVQQSILAGRIPLGTILRSDNIHHSYHVSSYFCLTRQSLISSYALNDMPQLLYGRRATISNQLNTTIADSIEIILVP